MAHTTVAEKNKALVRRFYAACDAGRLSEAFACLAADYVVHLPGQERPQNLEEYRRSAIELLSAFPDLEHVVEEQVAEGDRVAVRLTARGTHRGDLNGLPPTGRRVAIAEQAMFRLAGERIAEQWPQVDTLGMLRRLGVLAGPGSERTGGER